MGRRDVFLVLFLVTLVDKGHRRGVFVFVLLLFLLLLFPFSFPLVAASQGLSLFLLLLFGADAGVGPRPPNVGGLLVAKQAAARVWTERVAAGAAEEMARTIALKKLSKE